MEERGFGAQMEGSTSQGGSPVPQDKREGTRLAEVWRVWGAWQEAEVSPTGAPLFSLRHLGGRCGRQQGSDKVLKE